MRVCRCVCKCVIVFKFLACQGFVDDYKERFFSKWKRGGNAARPQKFSATHLLADYTTNVHGTDRPLRYYFFLLLLLDVCEEEEEEELEEVTSFFFFFYIILLLFELIFGCIQLSGIREQKVEEEEEEEEEEGVPLMLTWRARMEKERQWCRP